MTMKPDAGALPPAAEWVDPDEAPVLTEEFFADAEVFQDDKFVRRGRGRPPTGNAKEQVSVRLDRDVLAKLREAGPGWQSQVNVLLRAGLGLDQRGPVIVAPQKGSTVQPDETVFDPMVPPYWYPHPPLAAEDDAA